jgi:hypothetical protein
MKRLTLALGALALATFCTQTSKADTFSFSFTGSSFGGSGTLTATQEGNSNQYDITAISGVVDGQNILALLGVNSFASNDNVLYSPGFEETFLGFPIAGPFNFDSDGVSFELASGDRVNLSESGGFFSATETAQLDPAKNGVRNVNENVDISVAKIAATPEPGTLALLGTGILGAAGAIRRRLMA